MINKNKLVFDPADSANSDYVGSYIIGADGTEITKTTVSGKDGLDVNVINASLVVSATDLDIRDLVFATDKVDVSGSVIALDAGTLAALESITVSATDLDIRDLSHTQDSIKIGDGTDLLAISATGEASVIVTSALPAGNNNIGDVDVASLPGGLRGYAEDTAHASGDFGALSLVVRKDAIGSLVSADGDYSPLQVNASGQLRVEATVDAAGDYAEDSAHVSGDVGLYMLSVREDTLSSSTSASGDYQSLKTDALGRIHANNTHQTMSNAAVSVLVTATDLAATDLVNRKRILIQNLGTKRVYIGKDATVTTANGIELFAGSSMELDIGPSINVHAISASGTQDIRIMELA